MKKSFWMFMVTVSIGVALGFVDTAHAASGGPPTLPSVGGAQDGADATGATPPAGATGIRGWLSGIYAALTAAAGLKVQPLGAANTNLTYSAVLVGTTSTQVLAAATTLRSAVDLWNASGRTGGTTATDCYCSYGQAAVLGQGFLLAGYGANVSRDVPAVIDGRVLNCIAAAAVTISAGVAQQ